MGIHTTGQPNSGQGRKLDLFTIIVFVLVIFLIGLLFAFGPRSTNSAEAPAPVVEAKESRFQFDNECSPGIGSVTVIRDQKTGKEFVIFRYYETTILLDKQDPK